MKKTIGFSDFLYQQFKLFLGSQIPLRMYRTLQYMSLNIRWVNGEDIKSQPCGPGSGSYGTNTRDILFSRLESALYISHQKPPTAETKVLHKTSLKESSRDSSKSYSLIRDHKFSTSVLAEAQYISQTEPSKGVHWATGMPVFKCCF